MMNMRPFTKMHGLGNDFVIIDARETPFPLDGGGARAIADRKRGVGCDQLIVIEPARENLADAFMRILNADGSEVAACGNATRCVAAILMGETGEDHTVIETKAGLLDAAREDDRVRVDMGRVGFDWRDVPLAEACDTNHLDISVGGLSDPVALTVGNPHCVFFVENAETAPVAEVGPQVEHHPMFPERTNVQFVQVLDRQTIRQRVWERGVGITDASGTGACAGALAAARRDLTERRVEVILDGGRLTIEWLRDNHVVMTGPVSTSFSGAFDLDRLMAERVS